MINKDATIPIAEGLYLSSTLPLPEGSASINIRFYKCSILSGSEGVEAL
jgi:hypothetical protein